MEMGDFNFNFFLVYFILFIKISLLFFQFIFTAWFYSESS
jgi:hypothetical protein